MLDPRRPWRMQPDNFTPPQRTPWGGHRIATRYKRHILGAGLPACVGESWEVSVEPSFPSLICCTDGSCVSLTDAIAASPEAVLSPKVAQRAGGLPLLVKWLDAVMPLSVQVHPDDDYPGLMPHQSGKPEAWFIVEADPGAGLYLGLAEGVTRDTLRACLDASESLEPLLNFVPVASRDVFEIEAGTIHAIGGGITLVEPQSVLPGREGVTYRFWDWNRRYDREGRVDSNGAPRALHIDESLAVATFDGPRGTAFVDSTRRTPHTLSDAGGAKWQRFIDNAHFSADTWEGTGAFGFQPTALAACVVIAGSVEIVTLHGTDAFEQGESFVLPHAVGKIGVSLRDAWVVCSQPR